MIIVTGTYDKTHGYYRMHSPMPPYTSTVYIGYTRKEMEKKYREVFNLKGRHIDWVILGA